LRCALLTHISADMADWIARVAFGFHGHEPLIALAMLALGSHPPNSQAATNPRIQRENQLWIGSLATDRAAGPGS
jgi:hypothetical protein